LRIGWFYAIAELAQLADYSRSARLPRLFGDGWAPFLVSNSLVQDQPDQPTLSIGDGPDGLIMSQAWDGAAIDDLEDTSFDLYGGVRGKRPNSIRRRFRILLRSTRNLPFFLVRGGG